MKESQQLKILHGFPKTPSFQAEVDTDSSDDDNPDQINQTWSRNLKKTQIADFREQIGATFQLNEEKKEIDFFHKFFPSFKTCPGHD
jgi:hypothetical protein